MSFEEKASEEKQSQQRSSGLSIRRVGFAVVALASIAVVVASSAGGVGAYLGSFLGGCGDRRAIDISPHGQGITGSCPIAALSPKTLRAAVDETRERLASLLVPQLQAGNSENTAVVLAGAPRQNRAGSDSELPGYRQSGNMLYLLGDFHASGSLLVISPSKDGSHSLQLDLFLPDLTQTQAIFNGAPLDPAQVKKDYGLTNVFTLAQFNSTVFANYTLLTPEDTFASTLPLFAAAHPAAYSREIDNVFRISRQVKTPAEQKIMTYISQVAAWSHQRIERIISKHEDDGDVTETTLAAMFMLSSAMCGARQQAYEPIVGAGPHAAVLHYPTGEALDGGYTPIKKGTIVLVDAAGDYRGYASDITRTYVRGGHHRQSKLMKNIYKIVDKAQKDSIDAFQLGAPWSAVVAASAKSITKGLLKNGYLIGDLDNLLAAGVAFVFMPHGVGHRIGLDVHDPAPLPATPTGSSLALGTGPDTFAASMSRHGLGVSPSLRAIHDWQIHFDDLVLEPGSVMTIEPGVYFIPYYLDIVRNDPNLSPLINWSKIESDKVVEFGGVRIEDVLMINSKGKPVIISKLD
eukprot:jgi/Hompol1/6258/HPOL_004927-RA